MIALFDYEKPEKFLNDYILSLPKKGWGISRKIAAYLGVNTSLISLVLTGRQSLSMEQAFALTQFFGWKRLEGKYFLLMVQKERAGNIDLKKFYAEEMENLRKESLKLSERLENYKGLTEEQKSLFYSSSTYSEIRLYCTLGDNGKSLEDIQLEFELNLAELHPMLNFLIETGLLETKNDRYIMGHQHTHLPKGSPHLLKHQTNWRLKALQKAERLTDDELMFTGPMSMSKEDYMKVREEIVQLIKRTVDTMRTSPGEVVSCLNIDWIKIAD